MRVSAAIMDIPQVDVEAYQKQGFGRILHVSHDYLIINYAYPYLNNRSHQWIEITVF